MRSFLHLTKTSKHTKITIRDVFVADFLRLILSLAVMMVLIYGIGWLIGSTDPKHGHLSYYVQVFFTGNPLVESVMVAAACAITVGLKPSVRFWSTTGVAIFISLLDTPNFLWHLDVSGYLSIFAGIGLMVCGWRLWDYYDVTQVNCLTEPYLTRPALIAYILVGVLSLILLIPYGN